MANPVQLVRAGQFLSAHNSLTALVIGANESDRASLAFALECASCILYFAEDDCEICAALAAEGFPVVIMDGDSPTRCWREVLEQTLNSSGAHKPRFIVVSRHADDRLWAEVFNLGGYDLLPKPLDLGEVAWTVQTALAEQSAQRDWIRQPDTADKCVWSEC